jgi:hypothetical protein
LLYKANGSVNTFLLARGSSELAIAANITSAGAKIRASSSINVCGDPKLFGADVEIIHVFGIAARIGTYLAGQSQRR